MTAARSIGIVVKVIIGCIALQCNSNFALYDLFAVSCHQLRFMAFESLLASSYGQANSYRPTSR